MGGPRSGRRLIWRALIWSGVGAVALVIGASAAFWIWAEAQSGQDDEKLAAIETLRGGITEGLPASELEPVLAASGMSWSKHSAADYDPRWYNTPALAESLPDPADDYELSAIVDRVRWGFLVFESVRIRIAVRGGAVRAAEFESVYTGP